MSVLVMRALPFRVYIMAPCFGKLPSRIPRVERSVLLRYPPLKQLIPGAPQEALRNLLTATAKDDIVTACPYRPKP